MEDMIAYKKMNREFKELEPVRPVIASEVGKVFKSRSCAAVTLVVLITPEGDAFVLGSERGRGAYDYQGYYNLPCGYFGNNERASQVAARELLEETGVSVDPDNLRLVQVSTDPSENRQNICFSFCAVLNGQPDDFPFSRDGMEQDEVGNIRWIPVGEVGDYQWAYDHDSLIGRCVPSLLNGEVPVLDLYV